MRRVGRRQLNVDLAQAKKQINLVANLADISLDACLEPLALALPIRGTGTLKTELASEGTDFSQLTGNLAGTLKLEAKDGAVPVRFCPVCHPDRPPSAQRAGAATTSRVLDRWMPIASSAAAISGVSP